MVSIEEQEEHNHKKDLLKYKLRTSIMKKGEMHQVEVLLFALPGTVCTSSKCTTKNTLGPVSC